MAIGRWRWIWLLLMGVAIVLLRGGGVWQRAQLAVADERVLTQYVALNGADVYLSPFEEVGVGQEVEVEVSPAGAESPISQFMVALLAGDCALAEQVLEAGVTFEPTSSRLLLGGCWQEAGLPDRALATWQGVENVSLYFYLQGQICQENKDGVCERAYFEATVLTLNHAEWRSLVALLRYFNRPGDEIWLAGIVERLEEMGDVPAGMLAYAQAVQLSRTGQEGESLAYFDTAIANEPEGTRVFVDAGLAANRLQRYDLARDYWEQGLAVYPEYEDFYLFIGQAWRDEGRLDEAYGAYELAGDDRVESWRERAEVRFEQGRLEESFDLYEGALATRPGASLYSRASRPAVALQRYDQAEQWLREAVALESENVLYRLQLGEVCELVLNTACARRQYEAVLDLEPTHRKAQARLDGLDGN